MTTEESFAILIGLNAAVNSNAITDNQADAARLALYCALEELEEYHKTDAYIKYLDEV